MIGVLIVTYNQDQFISKAIESVLEQKECPEEIHIYIGEDCSTDNTRSICRQYVNQHREMITLIENDKNLGLVLNTISVLERIRFDKCTYIAMLDGDDFWCDPYKLKKQFLLFRLNPNFGLIHTDVFLLSNGELIDSKRKAPPIGYVFNQIEHISIANCTVVFKTELLDSIDLGELSTVGFLSLDYVMYALFSSYTEFGYIQDKTSVWRRDHNSVSNPNSIKKQIEYLNNDKLMWLFLNKKFPGRFGFNEKAWNDYFNKRVFNIAYRFNDYSLAHKYSKMIKRDGKLTTYTKLLCAKSIYLFRLWHRIKVIS